MAYCSRSPCGASSFFYLFLPFVYVGIFFLFYFVLNRKQTKILQKLSSYVPGKVMKFFFIPAFSGQYQGLPFRIELIPASKSSPPYLQISVYKNSSFRLTIYKESLLSDWGKKMRLVHEMTTGDEAFDKLFLIFTNNLQFGKMYLSNSSYRETIRKLFESGFNAFSLDGRRLQIRKPNYTQQELEPDCVITVLQKATVLAQGAL